MSARESEWRPIVRPFIRRVILATMGLEWKERRKAYRSAYPFVTRRGWKYQVWREEIDRQEAEFQRFDRWQANAGAFNDQVIAWLKG